MTAVEYANRAEQLLQLAEKLHQPGGWQETRLLNKAQIYATLALVKSGLGDTPAAPEPEPDPEDHDPLHGRNLAV